VAAVEKKREIRYGSNLIFNLFIDVNFPRLTMPFLLNQEKRKEENLLLEEKYCLKKALNMKKKLIWLP
jgi:hypothetical protein